MRQVTASLAFCLAAGLAFCLVGSASPTSAARAAESVGSPQESSFPAPPEPAATVCPSNAIEPLIAQLMLDLPSYSNRVIQRASQLGDPTPLYLHIAGQARVTPVEPDQFSEQDHHSRLPYGLAGDSGGDRPPEEIYQVRFTTLERQYLHPSLSRAGRTKRHAEHPGAGLALHGVEQQQNHSLILARRLTATASPWRIISLRSQLTPYPAEGRLLSPPRSSRPGPVGQGIATWLRDQQYRVTPEGCPPPGPAVQ